MLGLDRRSGVQVPHREVQECRTEGEAYNKEALDTLRAKFFDYVKEGTKKRVVEVIRPGETDLAARMLVPGDHDYIPWRTSLNKR